MNDKKKLKLILIITGVFLLTILGITFAFYNYTRTGENNKLIAGEVYLRYVENNQLTLNNAIPETKAQALLKENNVFSFKVEGKNTSTNDIFYDIIITYGDNQNGKTRLNDSDIRIYLEKDGVPIVDGITLEDWNKRVIYTDKMPALTNNHTVYNYELRMWVDEDVTVSDTDITADYTTTIWNNSYASMKINVNSGESIIETGTPASCFDYRAISNDGNEMISYDSLTFVYNLSDENVATCKNFFVSVSGGEDVSDAQDGYQSLCSGTGTVEGMTLETFVYAMSIMQNTSIDDMTSSLGVVESYEINKKHYELNSSEDAINSCMNVMMNMIGEDNSHAQDGYQSFCSGTGTVTGIDIIDFMNYDIDDFQVIQIMLINSNVFVETNKSFEVEITNYDVDTCGTDVIIPTYIDGGPVTSIGASSFLQNELTSISFPNTLRYIGEYSFQLNKLVKVVIPNSVVEIANDAFSANHYLANIEIGSGCQKIGESAFSTSSIDDVIISGNPSMENDAFSLNGTNENSKFVKFSYGGTCAELNSYSNIFNSNFIPQTIITSDSNSCVYNSWQ